MKQKSTIRILAVIALLAVSGLTAKAQWEIVDSLPTPRGFTTAQQIGGKIYVIGGALSPSESTSIVEVYDYYATDGNKWDTVASLPVPICAAASAKVGDKIYVFGGRLTTESPDFYNSVYEFDPENGPDGMWTLVDAMPLGPRAYFSACTYNDTVYLIGGRTESSFAIGRVEKYCPPSGEWSTLPDLNTPRGNLVTGQIHGIVYAIGGVNTSSSCCDVEEFNGIEWTSDTTDDGTPTFMDIWWGGSVTYGGNIYAFGGAKNETGYWSNETLKFNPHSGPSFFEFGPENKAAFATAILSDTGSEESFCMLAIGGILDPFFFPGLPGPSVSNTVMTWCGPLSDVKELKVHTTTATLSQNTPNPFSSQTMITFELKNAADVSLQVFDLSGQVVATLFDGYQGSGEHTVIWDAGGMPSGIYLYQLKTEEGVWMRKCILQNH